MKKSMSNCNIPNRAFHFARPGRGNSFLVWFGDNFRVEFFSMGYPTGLWDYKWEFTIINGTLGCADLPTAMAGIKHLFRAPVLT